MDMNAANDNIVLNDSYDWLSVLRPMTFTERAEELTAQLNNLVEEVENISSLYEHYPDHYDDYRGKELFEGEGNRPEFLTAEYNYDLVRTSLVRGYIALRHIELLNDLSVYTSDFPEHNSNDADFTLATAIAMKNGAKRAFSVIAGDDNWHADPDVEHVTSLADISVSINTLEDLVMDHFSHATSSREDKKIIMPRAKVDLVDEMNLNIHLYSVYALSQMESRLRYAKGLFNAMAYNPEELPQITREGYPHPDLYMNETLFTVKKQLNLMPGTMIAALQNNDLSLGTVSKLRAPVIPGQTRRGLPLYGLDQNS